MLDAQTIQILREDRAQKISTAGGKISHVSRLLHLWFVVKLCLNASSSNQSKISYRDHGMECYLNETKIFQRTSQRIWICTPWVTINKSSRIGQLPLDAFINSTYLSFLVIFKSSYKYRIVRLGVTFTSVQQPTLGALGCSGRGPRLPGWIAEDEKLLRGLPLIMIQFKSSRYSLQAESGSAIRSQILAIVQIGLEPPSPP